MKRDDRGSLPVALLLVMAVTALSALLAATSASRTASLRHSMKRQQMLAAAQTGFEVVLARIRAAVNAAGDGLRTSLPCGPFTGAVDATSRISYTVDIVYSTVGGGVLACTGSTGPSSTPAYADLTSTSSDPATGVSRTLTSRYNIRTSNQNIPGGSIPMIANLGTATVCFDAGGANPVAGTPLRLLPCVAGSKQQTFAYTNVLELKLVSSVSDLLPDGLCADGGAVPHGAADVVVTMQPCLTTALARQQWSINDANRYEGTSDGINLDAHCLSPQTNISGTAVVVRKTCNNDFNPDATAGAGAAGGATQQLVNYNEFGRCLDVAEYNWKRNFFWIWPCKQAPTVAGVSWNQKWTLPAIVNGPAGVSGYIVNYPSSTIVACLKSPMTTGVTAYVTLVACPAAGTMPTGNLKWTVHGDTGVYATSYTIVDSLGNCLAADDPSVPGGTVLAYGHTVSPAVTVKCSGSTLEKWNADPNVLKASPLTQVTEK